MIEKQKIKIKCDGCLEYIDHPDSNNEEVIDLGEQIEKLLRLMDEEKEGQS